jgi:hypothetical protein
MKRRRGMNRHTLSFSFSALTSYVPFPIFLKSLSFMKDHHCEEKNNKEEEFNSHSSGFSPLTGIIEPGVPTIC